jgi:hypothetical protein
MITVAGPSNGQKLAATLSPWEMASLLSAMLQHYLSSQLHNLEETTTCCLQLLQASSPEHHEAFVKHFIFSSWTKDMRLWLLIVQLLKTMDCSNDDNDDDNDVLLLNMHLCDIAETWSQWTFVQETESQQQHYYSSPLFCLCVSGVGYQTGTCGPTHHATV